MAALFEKLPYFFAFFRFRQYVYFSEEEEYG